MTGLTFRYPGGDHNVLSGLECDIPSGTTVAIVGPSGSGKTTLVSILEGLLRPQSGTIRCVDDAAEAFETTSRAMDATLINARRTVVLVTHDEELAIAIDQVTGQILALWYTTSLGTLIVGLLPVGTLLDALKDRT